MAAHRHLHRQLLFAIIPLKASTALAVTLPRNWTVVKGYRWLHCTRGGKVGVRAATTHGKLLPE